jgi:hypothetical protein
VLIEDPPSLTPQGRVPQLTLTFFLQILPVLSKDDGQLTVGQSTRCG